MYRLSNVFRGEETKRHRHLDQVPPTTRLLPDGLSEGSCLSVEQQGTTNFLFAECDNVAFNKTIVYVSNMADVFDDKLLYNVAM